MHNFKDDKFEDTLLLAVTFGWKIMIYYERGITRYKITKAIQGTNPKYRAILNKIIDSNDTCAAIVERNGPKCLFLFSLAVSKCQLP